MTGDDLQNNKKDIQNVIITARNDIIEKKFALALDSQDFHHLDLQSGFSSSPMNFRCLSSIVPLGFQVYFNPFLLFGLKNFD